MSVAFPVCAYSHRLCGVNDAAWRTWPLQLTFANRTVHVWQCLLDTRCGVDRQLAIILDDQERTRAASFRFDTDRHAFLLRHIALRHILGSYLGLSPKELRFERGQFGKPVLAHQAHGGRLHFNLTHSAGLALIAVAWRHAVGVDVERIDSETDLFQIANQFTTPSEYRRLCQLPQRQRHRATLRLWVRKEAYAKASGRGVTGPLQELDVSGTEVSPSASSRREWQPRQHSNWHIRNLDPAPDYVGALVVEQEDGPLHT